MSYRPCDLDTAEKVIEAMARALATARADGRREGLEMAAAWHDLQVETLQAFVPASSQIERDIEIHRDAATAIRAMIEHEEG